MNREKITEIVGQIDEKHIDEATAFAANAGRSAAPKARRFRWGMAAACLLLILVLGSATYAYAAEAKEYRAAVVFHRRKVLNGDAELLREDILRPSVETTVGTDCLARSHLRRHLLVPIGAFERDRFLIHIMASLHWSIINLDAFREHILEHPQNEIGNLFAKHPCDSNTFSGIVVPGSCSVTANVINIRWLQISISECALHCKKWSLTIGRCGCLMERIAKISIAI